MPVAGAAERESQLAQRERALSAYAADVADRSAKLDERLRREQAERFLLLQLPSEILRTSPPFELDMSERTAAALVHAGYVAAADAFARGEPTRLVERAVQFLVATILDDGGHGLNEEYPPAMP